jgi:hypothetical protein
MAQAVAGDIDLFAFGALGRLDQAMGGNLAESRYYKQGQEIGTPFAVASIVLGGAGLVRGGYALYRAATAERAALAAEPSFATGAAGEAALNAKVGGLPQVEVNIANQSTRIIDQVAGVVAYEMKVGRVAYTARIASQIARDRIIRQSRLGGIRESVWVFGQSAVTGQIGASARVLAELEQAGIKFVSFGSL